MENHIRNVGWILIGTGIAFAVLSLGVLIAYGGFDGILLFNDPFFKRRDMASIPLDRLLMLIFVSFSLLMAAPLVIAGRGVLKFQPWARMMALLVCAVNLLHFPIGSGLSIYCFWVLTDQTSEFLFDNPPVESRR